MAMVKLRIMADRFQSDIWEQALQSENIPYQLKGLEMEMFGSTSGLAKGYGVLYVDEKIYDQAKELDEGLMDQLPLAGSAGSLVSMIDHTLLDPKAGTERLNVFLEEALSMNCASVCVLPWMVKYADSKLRDSDVAVGTVVDFPLGGDTAMGKKAAALRAMREGAAEVDVVLNRGLALHGDLDKAVEEILETAEAAPNLVVKVILEIRELGLDLSRKAAEAFCDTNVDFLKTGTGFYGSTSVEQVRLLKEVVGDRMGIKAAGGIRTFDQALDLVEAGADRLGASKGHDIWLEVKKS